MKTAEEVLKKEVLKETNGMLYEHNITHKNIIRAMKEFAIAVAKESLNNAAKNVRMKTKDNIDELSLLDEWTMVDKSSILNENNIPKL